MSDIADGWLLVLWTEGSMALLFYISLIDVVGCCVLLRY